MKKIISLFLILSFSACSQADFTLNMMVATGVDYNGRQAYLLGYYDSNSAMWLDSTKITNNHAKFRAKLPYKEMLCEVIVKDCPTSFQQFRFFQGENASFVFDPTVETLYPPIKGSAATEAATTYWSDISSYFNEQRKLRKKLMPTDISDVCREKIAQQIENVSDDIRLRSLKLLSETKSFINAYLAYAVLCDRLSDDSLTTIKQQMLQRWPNDVNRSILTGISTITGDSLRDATPQTKSVLNRRAVLLGDLPPYPEEQAHTEYSDAEVYTIKSSVSDFSLPDKLNNKIALSSFNTPYVLIDFWASWCRPCREEMPNLLSVAKDYENEFAVYAVSIDENSNRWKQAIDDDDTELLTHVLLRKDNPNYERLFQLFEIKTIPHNFLLDEKRTIIAIDLQGEELQKTLRQLLSEE